VPSAARKPAAQLLGLVDRGQRLEELDAGGEVVDRESGVRLEHDPPGSEAVMKTPSGPSSETANLMVKPPMPAS